MLLSRREVDDLCFGLDCDLKFGFLARDDDPNLPRAGDWYTVAVGGTMPTILDRRRASQTCQTVMYPRTYPRAMCISAAQVDGR